MLVDLSTDAWRCRGVGILGRIRTVNAYRSKGAQVPPSLPAATPSLPPAMPHTPNTALREKQRSAAGFLTFGFILDTVSWALFGYLIHLVHKETDAYYAALQACDSPNPSPSSCNLDPRTHSLPWALTLTLPPLIFSSLTVPIALALALQKRLHPVLILCVAVPSFCLWISLGILNALSSDPYLTENMNPMPVDKWMQGVAGMQCASGAAWLIGMSMAARWVHVHNQEKWATRWMEERARSMEGTGLPPYNV
ncbi:uncharacterized protein CC84DRAFT_1259087 [Paraphaeosphaeria sporulosa]|uniref:Uncharacterized protein n=1 Tax=Paraphaeosphaeria sporulosa TaxID=1460663 RepID=A0A177CDH6_9PLEO|nr:uncharacterized protein CC84DRAFT_1259087 [Paraphaeosphaeria sporulosa]OAG05695.1 hypothetical protein CC84DRAFT_1259087 [Paraphaeosphaeria sporulosa]